MKLSSRGWSLLGLAIIIVLVGYVLNGGPYVGSSINISTREGEGTFPYSKNCRYRYLNGVHEITGGAESPSREDAEATSCAPLGDTN